MKLAKGQNEILKEGSSILKMDFTIDINKFLGEDGEINTWSLSGYLEDMEMNMNDPNNDGSYFKTINHSKGCRYYSHEDVLPIEDKYKDYCKIIRANKAEPIKLSEGVVMILSLLIYSILGYLLLGKILFHDYSLQTRLTICGGFVFYGWYATFRAYDEDNFGLLKFIWRLFLTFITAGIILYLPSAWNEVGWLGKILLIIVEIFIIVVLLFIYGFLSFLKEKREEKKGNRGS